MPGVAVDGQDVCAVYDAAAEAVARARRGEGPTLIEAKTYRFDEHEVGLAVPGVPYRSAEEVEEYRTHRDPIALFRDVLSRDGFSDTDLQEIEDEVAEAVDEAIQFGTASSPPDPAAVNDHLYVMPVH
jgi:TPP-dependent pyruvate/acetoin dehydrogenase alpha subunit